MKPVEDIDRSLVVIFDIEGFSKEVPEQQARLVHAFVDKLDSCLQGLEQFHPDAFSTGDGAIVSIGRKCKINRDATLHFMDFLIEFTLDLIREGLIIRTVANYSERDKVVALTESKYITGEYIQIGDTINVATRILNFAEPREIMISDAVYQLLRRLELPHTESFSENDEFVTKHRKELRTFTYQPSGDASEILYCPTSPAHPYKRFSNFPPIMTSTLQFFMDNGLDFELRKVISNAYESMRFVSDTRTFLSWNTVLNVLIQLLYDPDDNVHVLSRNDSASNFWTQRRRNQYIRYLEANAEPHGGYINQTRVMVYDDTRIPSSSLPKVDELMPDDDIYFDLERLHKTDTFFSFPSSHLFKYEHLAPLRFGFTLSERHHYAIIPIPTPEGVDTHRLAPLHIGELLERYKEYDISDGPMKAIITGDHKYVGVLLAELKRLIQHQQTRKIK